MLALFAWRASLELKEMTIAAERNLDAAKFSLHAVQQERHTGAPLVATAEQLQNAISEGEKALLYDRDDMRRLTPIGQARRDLDSARMAFERHVEKHKLDKDMKAWARNGQEWRDRLVAIANRLHARITQERAIEFRKNIATAAEALLFAFDAPIDPDSRLMALCDLREELAKAKGYDQASDDPGALDAILESVANLRIAAQRAVDDYDPGVLATAPCKSVWGRFVLDMRGFAKANDLPYKIGASTAGRNDRYAPFAEFLWLLQERLPPHLRYKKSKSTFIREAKEAVRDGENISTRTEMDSEVEPLA